MTQPRPTHRRRSGRFENPLPTERPRARAILAQWMRNRAPSTPRDPPATEPRTRSDFRVPPETGLRVTWLGHATSLIELEGARFLVDPVWGERSSPLPWMGPKRFFDPPLPLEELPPVDAVLISHNHYDHLDRHTVHRLSRAGLSFIVPLRVGEHLVRWGVPRARIRELGWWESVEIGGVTITATPARHFSGRSPLMTDRDRTLWAGFALGGPERRLYYAGDTAMFDGFESIGRALGPFDATLIEIGAYNRLWADLHLGPEQAVEAFRQVGGGLLIPVHWATFELAMHGWTEPVERLLVAAERHGVPVAIPKPGQSVEPARPPTVARWWPDLPWESAEDHPVVSSGFGATGASGSETRRDWANTNRRR